jgi:hypothetical protein
MDFSKEDLQTAKFKSTDKSNPDSWITTFDALSAYIYQAVHRARLRVREKQNMRAPLSRLDFFTVVDLRNPLPQLGPSYFPKTRTYALLTCSPTLMTGPTSDLAREIHGVPYTPALTHSKVLDESLLWIAVKFDISELTTEFQFGSGSLMVSQWNNFDR